MQSIPPIQGNILARAAVLASLLALSGCNGPQVIFDGVALVRSNGQVVVVHKAESIAALKDYSLNLSATEVELLRTIATWRDQAHARAHSGSAAMAATESGRCLTGTGNPPTCYPVLPCKDCKVVALGTDSSGAVGTPATLGAGSSIPYSAPYSYYCECSAW